MELVERRFTAMGSPCELRVYASSAACGRRAVGVGEREVTRLERKYSRYRDDSITARINGSAGDRRGVAVDDETAGLLDYADTLHSRSAGLFDITSGILRRAWDFRSGRVPARDELATLLPCVGWRRTRWRRPRIVLPLEGMEIDFGGYVKEYAADRVAARLREVGIRHGLVDLGGDLAVVGPHPDGSPWRVGIRNPRDPASAIGVLPLSSGAIATSGDYERFMIVEGRRYAHILDPRTGWPVSGFASVSVVASHCLIAGTASTVAMLKGRDAGSLWLDQLGLPNLRVSDGGRITGSLHGGLESGLDAAARERS
jgi:thiamine biosynthesis lipoprotein